MKQKQRGEINGADGEHDLIDQLYLSTGMKESGGEGCVPAVVDGRVSQGTSVIDPGPGRGCSPILGDGRLHKLGEVDPVKGPLHSNQVPRRTLHHFSGGRQSTVPKGSFRD